MIFAFGRAFYDVVMPSLHSYDLFSHDLFPIVVSRHTSTHSDYFSLLLFAFLRSLIVPP